MLLFCDKLLLWRSAPVRIQLINHPVDVCVQKTAQSFCLNILILDNSNDVEERLQPGCCPCGKGTNLVGRKVHCGYLQVDDNKNITLHDSLEFFFHSSSSSIQTKANNTQSEIVFDLFSGHNTTPDCVYAGFSLTTVPAVTLHK